MSVGFLQRQRYLVVERDPTGSRTQLARLTPILALPLRSMVCARDCLLIPPLYRSSTLSTTLFYGFDRFSICNRKQYNPKAKLQGD